MSLRILKHIPNTNTCVCAYFLVFPLREITEGTNIHIVQLHLVKIIAKFSKFLGYKNLRNGKWTVCKASDCSTD
jgi:hypothetical protein